MLWSEKPVNNIEKGRTRGDAFRIGGLVGVGGIREGKNIIHLRKFVPMNALLLTYFLLVRREMRRNLGGMRTEISGIGQTPLEAAEGI